MIKDEEIKAWAMRCKEENIAIALWCNGGWQQLAGNNHLYETEKYLNKTAMAEKIRLLQEEVHDLTLKLSEERKDGALTDGKRLPPKAESPPAEASQSQSEASRTTRKSSEGKVFCYRCSGDGFCTKYGIEVTCPDCSGHGMKPKGSAKAEAGSVKPFRSRIAEPSNKGKRKESPAETNSHEGCPVTSRKIAKRKKLNDNFTRVAFTDLSRCISCGCMTHTIEKPSGIKKCGKCFKVKP